MFDRGPFDPPKLVYVRVPAVGRQTEDLAVWGLLHAWRQAEEWGVRTWEALVSTDPAPDAPRRWVTGASVWPRQPGDP